MIAGALKLTLLAALVILTIGVFPNRRTGAVFAIGTCVVGAAILHFAAP